MACMDLLNPLPCSVVLLDVYYDRYLRSNEVYIECCVVAPACRRYQVNTTNALNWFFKKVVLDTPATLLSPIWYGQLWLSRIATHVDFEPDITPWPESTKYMMVNCLYNFPILPWSGHLAVVNMCVMCIRKSLCIIRKTSSCMQTVYTTLNPWARSNRKEQMSAELSFQTYAIFTKLSYRKFYFHLGSMQLLVAYCLFSNVSNRSCTSCRMILW